MSAWFQTLSRRASLLARSAFLVFVLGLAVLVPTTAVTVEYTAQPEFCNSCHIMEPFYESWKHSSHADVSCIECHYEPGTLETVAGKFQAISQLAKYVTRTQGTKPWAEVSDLSCMREGCHSVRSLEGQIDFRRVKFDHRQHLLESRRGRSLRCTSCHSQVLQGDHMSVDESVCFTCHFMPPGDHLEERSDGCLVCHHTPEGELDVAGRAFVHADYVERGVDCRECHGSVVEGEGQVRRGRCKSCHGEPEYIERFDETDYLHEVHVTEHRVECFECHDEIHHGLPPLELPEITSAGDCGSCHVDAHDATRLLYAGTGALGVAERPSRMFETRVECTACHTGRSGPRGVDDGRAPVRDAHHAASARPQVPRAGNVDCIHCHGVEYDGMLASWQAAVDRQLDSLRPLLDELSARPAAELGEQARLRLEAARSNLELVEMDGSRGAHNVTYVLDVLARAGEDLSAARALADPDAPAAPLAAPPFLSAQGCSECHLDLEREEPTAAISHGRHLVAAGLDCDACHSVEDHGAPAFPRNECASCHHEEREDEDFDPWDCATCHERQESYATGTLEGFEELPGGMAEKDCSSCHGEPPDVAAPNVQLCVLCHEEGYDALPDQWRARTRELTALVEEALRAGGAAAEAVERARRALDAVAADGSAGAHNIELTERLLSDALESLK